MKEKMNLLFIRDSGSQSTHRRSYEKKMFGDWLMDIDIAELQLIVLKALI